MMLNLPLIPGGTFAISRSARLTTCIYRVSEVIRDARESCTGATVAAPVARAVRENRARAEGIGVPPWAEALFQRNCRFIVPSLIRAVPYLSRGRAAMREIPQRARAILTLSCVYAAYTRASGKINFKIEVETRGPVNFVGE